jgi:hypothetical protein
VKHSEAAELVMMLLGAYPNAKTSLSTSQVYETMLGDLDAEPARAAVVRLIASSKWMPTVAEIRGAAADIEHGPVRSGADAWLDVMSEMRRVGNYSAPTFDDALVESIVRRWGWTALCLSTNETADRARFVEAYDGLARQARERDVSGMALPAAPKSNQLRRAR